MSTQLSFALNRSELVIPKTLRLTVPPVLTKELAISRAPSHGRRIVVSSNLLDAYGFSARRTRYNRLPLGSGMAGFVLRTAAAGEKRVYERSYTQRRANPCETQIDEASQRFLDRTIPQWAERCHVIMRPGEIRIQPRPNPAFHIRKRFEAAASPLSAFLSLSSGVDAFSLQSLGFRICGLNEWRPPERRDKTSDFSESGVLTALANLTDRFPVFNEDIMRVDMATVRAVMGEEKPDLYHISLQCDDHSRQKSPTDKRRAIAEGTSTRPMVFDALRFVQELEPVVFVAECVEAFATSPECDLLVSRLRQWAYHPSVAVLDSRDHGGLTRRPRAFVVASLYPGFRFPEPLPRRTTPLWPEIADDVAECRDVSHLAAHHGQRRKTLQPDMAYAPCLQKSQSHQPSDALYLEPEPGKFLLPTERLFARLNEIPPRFTFEATNASLALEQIGQSISFVTHHRLMSAVRDHLLANRRRGAAV